MSPRSVWSRLRDEFLAEVESLPMGDVTDFLNFMGAAIDDRAFGRIGQVLERVRADDGDYDQVVGQVADDSAYALTGSVVAQDRQAIEQATERLRFAAGNFYLNDKPTGAVVGQQPFGGARASGTNDKAGSMLNLLRWVSPRAIKETFVPPTDYRYPHMG
jgi:1-pyrroline-5-carboxylate dehydrogenase